jgi:hypothetical protein
MAGLVPAIHVLSQSATDKKTWMPGTSSAKTRFALLPGHDAVVRSAAYSCPSSVSPPDTSTLPGAGSRLNFFTVPSSTSIE